MSRRRRRTRTVVSAGSTGAAPSAGGREPVLRFALFGVLGLLLLTPFVVTPGTVYPFVVGKALWSRSLIAVAFALWALLALLHPGYRPPRSWLLVLLVAGYGATVLSAGFGGVHPGHSLSSDYERMQGVVDQAHWVVLAVQPDALRGPVRQFQLPQHLHAGQPGPGGRVRGPRVGDGRAARRWAGGARACFCGRRSRRCTSPGSCSRGRSAGSPG